MQIKLFRKRMRKKNPDNWKKMERKQRKLERRQRGRRKQKGDLNETREHNPYGRSNTDRHTT